MWQNWSPPPDWTHITTIDAHAAGEPLRVITSGLPPIPGETILAKRRYARAEAEVDRSPTGTGVSRRVALEHTRGRLQIGEPFVAESLIGTRFTGRVVRTTAFGEFAAVIPEVEGSAWITRRNEFWIAPDDPLKEGAYLAIGRSDS